MMQRAIVGTALDDVLALLRTSGPTAARDLARELGCAPLVAWADLLAGRWAVNLGTKGLESLARVTFERVLPRS